MLIWKAELRSDTLARSLPPQLLKEFILLHGSGLPQQFEQGIL